MGFPTTPILDSFTRADVGPPPSASWSSGLKVVSNRCVASALFDFGYWNTTFSPDMECYCTVQIKPLVGNAIELFVRQDAGNSNGYYMLCTTQAGTDTLELRKQVGGSTSSLAIPFNQEFSVGDSLGISANGTTISAWYKASAGAWTLLGTATDTSFTGSNFIAAGIDDLTAAIDDFGGGITTGIMTTDTDFWGGV